MRLGVSKPRLPILQKGHPLTEGLVGAWLAYEGAGLTARDVSGRGNHGTLESGVTWTVGKDGRQLTFDGTNGVPIPALFGSRPDEVTFVIRARANTATTEYRILGYNEDAATCFFLLRLNAGADNQIQWLVLADASNNTVDTTSYSTTQARTIAGVAVNESHMDLYVDGDFVGTTSIGTFGDTAGDRYIGANRNNTSVLAGDISYTLAYDRALHASQIRALHADPYTAFRYQPRFWQVILDVAALPQRRRYKIVSGDAIVGSSVVRDKSN